MSWTAKDPNEVLNYVYDWSAELGEDTILTSNFVATVPSGASIVGQSHDGKTSTVIVSGGISGQAVVFTLTITTAGGNTHEAMPQLFIIDNAAASLPTGYVLPTAAQLVAAFPEFAGVNNIDFWITRGARMADMTWTEEDYAFAVILYACHLMALAGMGTGPDAKNNSGAMSGFSEIRSGQLTLKRKGAADTGGNDGSLLTSTSYGRQYYTLLRLNRPRASVAAAAYDASIPWMGYPMGEW